MPFQGSLSNILYKMFFVRSTDTMVYQIKFIRSEEGDFGFYRLLLYISKFVNFLVSKQVQDQRI